ncbi:MAG: carbohydrate ABC transporter substrate-binding protein [Clostridiales bacterium]|nr:carbohydrate ABC transporter substrate-binding protein [Clostridiales bacterium]
MKNIRKFIALFVICAMSLSLYGCSFFANKTESAGEKINADKPWYDCEILECSAKIDENAFVENDTYQCPVGKISDGYIFAVKGYDLSVLNLYLYSEKGGLLAQMDLRSKIRESYPNINMSSFSIADDLYVVDGFLKMKANNYSDKTVMVFDIDIKSDSVVLLDSYEFSRGLASVYEGDQVRWTRCGEYDLYTSLYEDFSILTVGPDGSDFCFAPGSEFANDLSGFVSDLIPVSSTQVLFYDYQKYNYFIYDAAQRKLSKNTSDYDWIKPYFTWYREDISHNIGMDGQLYFVTPDGFSTPDFVNKRMNDIVMLENVDINRTLVNTMNATICKVMNANEETVDFAVCDSCLKDCNTVIDICKATRAKTNPNAGKILITTDGYPENAIYDAIYSFNKTDKDYFIKIVPNIYSDKEHSSYGSDLPEIYTKGEVSSRMMVDLKSGNSPDIVFYVSKYGQLNNGKCMMDLKPYYESSKLKDEVFDNVIKSCENNGALYAVPLSFVLDGIIVDRSKYDVEGSGMTFEQFKEFTDSYSNGINVIARSKTDFISECLKCEYDLLEHDGAFDFDCPAFRDVVEYSLENIDDLELDDYLNSLKKDYAPSLGVEGYLGWFNSVYDVSVNLQNADLVGFPSGDGRGPAAEIRRFVSVSQGSKCPQGAWRFIEKLLSQDVQTDLCRPEEDLATQNSFPVNRKAFDAVGEVCLERYNRQMKNRTSFMVWDTDSTDEIGADSLDTIRTVTESVNHIVRSDSDIDIIIYEDIQPFLARDKSLDDTIKIMNNRAGTVIKERQ